MQQVNLLVFIYKTCLNARYGTNKIQGRVVSKGFTVNKVVQVLKFPMVIKWCSF